MGFVRFRIAFACLIALLLTTCRRAGSCDCFDEPDFEITVIIDYKSFKTDFVVPFNFHRESSNLRGYFDVVVPLYGKDSVVSIFGMIRIDKDTFLSFTVPSGRLLDSFVVKSDSFSFRKEYKRVQIEGTFSGGECSCFNLKRKVAALNDSLVDITNGAWIRK